MGHGVHSTRGTTLPFSCYSCSARSSSSVSLTQRQRPPSLGPSYVRYAVLGAGFAGLSVAWHLLKQSPKDSRIRIDIYDEVGIGGGASGVSGGLLHPYSPKAKLLWRAADCWNESLNLLSVAEAAAAAASAAQNPNEDDPLPIVRRRFAFFFIPFQTLNAIFMFVMLTLGLKFPLDFRPLRKGIFVN